MNFYVEALEYLGQQEVINKNLLPKRNNGIDSNARKIYEQMGITIMGEYDSLFWCVQLPEGWEVRATNHNMWTELFDEKGTKRAQIFYKAAPYDRRAFVNICKN